VTAGGDPVTELDAGEQRALADTLLRAMTATPSGPALDAALDGIGWPDLLAGYPRVAIPLVFRLLGETGSAASVLNDVVLAAIGAGLGGEVALPYAGGGWVRWSRTGATGDGLDPDLPLTRVPEGAPVPLAAARVAAGWWLLGTGRRMLALARTHVVERTQFGRPLASFQAVRHRLAEAHVAVEGAQATLEAATEPGAGEMSALLAKAAAGQAALATARHTQQVLGGMGFTAEHEFHHHLRRALTLDGLLGSARELTREAGALLREEGRAPRLVQL
jgi:hypothetical protein